ncbi:hypothetical protein N790_14965 [Arenimonas malthae CC-JY-1]|uniref:Uncharacterized protein n=1 Tax=Arenimonas malthae CC-JY-1 TaxID=1384054 RepID=A0A091BJ26_9GAMM|nr:hypothetical protein N790_14965 [Arenimonas malthae CC-JY-1]
MRVTASQLDADLISNLRDLYGWHSREMIASETQRHAVIEMMRERLDDERPAYLLVKETAKATSLSDYDVHVVLYQAIWRRELRIDLFSPLLMTKRLSSEREDPFERYASWFER